MIGAGDGSLLVSEPKMNLLCDASDDTSFMEIAEQAVASATMCASSEYLHVVKIDSWFGNRWYSFSGKLLGLAGVHCPRLTVPPFHPHRVVHEVRYRTDDPTRSLPPPRPLHKRRASQSNLRNFIQIHGDSITFAWISGNTEPSGRGAIMVYGVGPEGASGWYVGLERTNRWRAVKYVEIDQHEWTALICRQPAAR
jgi:hypothetical protein